MYLDITVNKVAYLKAAGYFDLPEIGSVSFLCEAILRRPKIIAFCAITKRTIFLSRDYKTCRISVGNEFGANT